MKPKTSQRFIFLTLLLIVAIAGMSQGLTLPLLSVLLEQAGVSTVANGFNAAALYIGILLVSPLMEIPLRKYGYRTTILIGLCIVTVSTLLLPVFRGFTVWFILRLLLGVGDVALHYAAQMWVTALAPVERRGRDLSIYGFAYGAGFSFGPLGMLLLGYGIWAPFLAISVFYIAAFVMLLRLKNDFPEPVEASAQRTNRYLDVIRLGWLALIPPFLYGYMESALNVNFPVFAVRNGISLDWVSIILPSFVVGSLLLQMPLGRWSDRIGRKKIMMACAAIGAVCFLVLPLVSSNVWALMALLVIAGATVGSFYTLGLAFAADILPAGLLSTAGAIASIMFGVANIVAPNVNGYFLSTAWPGLMFGSLGIMLALFVGAGFLDRKSTTAVLHDEKIPHPM
ncbi:MFS transporter [Tumebacillus permanentifrigoris]|uniref:Putative MFS family arabinose efflux permease n=1 Tax=Tumebacillus permanentifrigoris TaxID=378543 RepID=A0A316D7J1_9BACL|nr:MFS transporter [Tumebacillus permanentifrigoris]PWK05394.1 putative MFS family arabinose efflux permease [Tumebacillus permanentifrigoris]